MRFIETAFSGVFIVEMEPKADERGFFARTFCSREFSSHGLKTAISQCNISLNALKGTIRGMHFQRPPKAEAKLIRCVRGSLYDVIIDLRPGSPTYCRWESFELTANDHRSIYVPEGFAHGFQTLIDDTEIFYQMFEFYTPDLADGVRWDDPAFEIRWPLSDPIVSARDKSYLPFQKVQG